MSEQERDPRDGDGNGSNPPGNPPPSSSAADDSGPELDVDSAFAAIVAGWSSDSDTGSWPDEENLGVPRHRRTDDPSPLTDPERSASGRPTEVERPTADDAPEPDLFVEHTTGPRDYAARPDPDEDRFVPPDPGPLPRGDWISILSWTGALGGPLFLLVAVLVWRADTPTGLVFAAVAAFVAGFVALVVRMPRDRDDDDGDDGAVV